MTIVPPSRPKRDRSLIDAVLERYSARTDRASLIFVRGHYLDSLGQRGENDFNLYDDAAYLYAPGILESYNANTDPAFLRKKNRDLAQLALGHYTFYPDLHKPGKPGAYKALRPYPEGIVLPCLRNGKPSTCSHTNIHKGGASAAAFDRTWSEGCMTIFGGQYPDWQLRVWDALSKFPQARGSKTRTGKDLPLIDMFLVENRVHNGRQFWTDHQGKIIA